MRREVFGAAASILYRNGTETCSTISIKVVWCSRNGNVENRRQNQLDGKRQAMRLCEPIATPHALRR
jgi:hypothetical protein